MKRIAIEPRPHWREYAQSVGFNFHTFDGEPYWNETAYYQFTLQQIERDLETPTEEIHAMAMALVSDIMKDEHKLQQLGIPENFWNHIANTRNKNGPYLYGRMDFVYDGNGTAKLLELNYDTPTSLFETGFFQWVWLEEQIQLGKLPPGADQFNSLQDKLELAFRQLLLPEPFYFSSVAESTEDKGTVAYLMDIAHQAGMKTEYIAIEDIGEAEGQFVDLKGYPIAGLFKLYPWEFLIHENFASVIKTSNTLWLEPCWKLLLSNKGILPLLWEKYPNHPNLLPSFFENSNTEPLTAGWVRKPLFSREGANIELITTSGERLLVPGPYDDAKYIRQALQPLPRFDNNYTLIGSWVVGDEAAGICIREDDSLITKNSSRFVPHIILD
jgi:glutathionylspermidine synthase